MIATITYTRRPLWVRLSRRFMVAYLRGWIRDEEAHCQRLRTGGVYTPAEIAQRESNLGPTRVLLAWWESA